tara:strand:- start:5979 stop:6200 length:222 start_codon:yes stop_codon:yes gene_type:complete
MNNYTLYVDNNCSSCKKIQQYISENNILVKTVNIDNENYDLPFTIMIIPALVKENKLLAYGPDITSILDQVKK